MISKKFEFFSKMVVELNRRAIPILKDPHILAAAIEENRRVLTPLMKVLDHMGLPLFDDEIVSFTEKFINDISETP